jgi:Trk K+ transport system NAD-binding subunit
MSRKKFVVIGLGNFGASVAATLHELGHEVVAMDRDPELPRKHGIILVALHDILRDEMVPVPDPDGALKESDTLLVAGTDEALMKAGKMERS